MTAAALSLVDFLVAEMEATEETVFADELLAAAKAQITAGKGSIGFMTSASQNGKSFTRAQGLNCLEVAVACRRALQLYGGQGGQITVPDFGGGL